MGRTSSIEDAIKLFAMSNQLLESDLDRVESQTGVELGRKNVNTPEKDATCYPQFDEAIRTEAARMAEHYEIFYCLERSIRNLIEETLRTEAGLGWWDAGKVPALIHGEVAKRIQREVDSAVTLRSSNPIDFTTFGELGEIVKANWAVFGSLFTSQKAVEKVMSNLNIVRGPIAHCTELAPDEVERLRLSVRDWYRLME